ncbi:MAG TPA: hypothetical protein VFT19_04810 [Solirubrobacterales bacterium]|nr:hypothetical protein [Solirubrobacterales bacterium]
MNDAKHTRRVPSAGIAGAFAVPARLLRLPGRGTPSGRLATALLGSLALALALTAPASASFGLSDVEVSFTDEEGSPVTQAGAHPFEMTTSFEVNSKEVEEGGESIQVVDGQLRDLDVDLPAGFAGNPTAVPTCDTVTFLDVNESCPDSTVLGTLTASLAGGLGIIVETTVPVYNLAPAPGVAQKQGFIIQEVPVTLNATVNPRPPHNVHASLSNTSQVLEVFSSELTLWGNPAAKAHDPLRGSCLDEDGTSTGDNCEAGIEVKPFITLPRSCQGPLRTEFTATSWWSGDPLHPGPSVSFATGAPSPAMGGCASLGFAPSISAEPSTRAAQSPTGLEFSLEVPNPGLSDPGAEAANSDIEKTVVTLPEGMTINPSQAEGLEACSEAQLARESADSAPGEGCPEASKIGSIEVETPLLERRLLTGDLFVAKPYENPFGSLIAVYVTVREPELGIFVSQPLEVSPDSKGRLTTTAEDMPQLPFSDFRLRFREGARAPLISPPGCGTFDTKAVLYPWSGTPPVESTSSFQIVSGPNNSPCPSGAAPFHPGFEAGTLNNAAGRYSPFDMRITRGDGEQDLTKFSAILPPGVVGKIAGVAKCPDAAIALAASRKGPHGGQEELDHPSCPAASQIGATTAGAGVGSQLTYVPGKLYLAGPYNGDPLSVVSITPAVAGPFDAGTVVVRIALTLNPVTGVVEADGAASDAIPHILKGIPLNLRDLRVHVDRPEFTLNATSCKEEQARATLFGGGTVLAPTADTPVSLSSRYQAAGCASLGFEPRLGIKLKGGTKRGAHPALKAVVTPRKGDANFSRAVVTLPRSAFLDQAHIRTICTRVQFAAGAGNGSQCPKGAVYGHARAWSPLLDQPLSGPVFLRSSNHNLPDMVVALHGLVDIELSARIDSVKGGIRSTFTGIPDAPVSRFILNMQGGKKGLIVNSRHLCRKPARNRAKANLLGQNGRFSRSKPRVIATACQKRRKAKRSSHARVSGVARASKAG